ncbi:MAG: YbaK/EbsC family protein [Anaerolineaceae bacterium]|nr:YbaK/EbsC family protein [Anaerolineaceae bacterium]
MNDTLSNAAQKVQDALNAQGFSYQVIELPQTTRTAVEAAQAVGCQVEQIAKSILFKTRQTGRPILAIASGINRIDEHRLSELAGEKVEKPDADFVREKTGFVIGGVPPIGHSQKLETYIDEDLLKLSEIWAAAGTPFAVFKLLPTDLPAITGGSIVAIKKVAQA